MYERRGRTVGEQTISDDETIFRRIPPIAPWFEPPDRITSANFRLRKSRNEQGLSTYRASIVSAEAVLAKPDAIEGSFVVTASVGEIRALMDGNGKPLNLEVVAVADEHDPGHAEIRSPKPGTLSDSASKALTKLFGRR
jgi:hypothetical protein